MKSKVIQRAKVAQSNHYSLLGVSKRIVYSCDQISAIFLGKLLGTIQLAAMFPGKLFLTFCVNSCLSYLEYKRLFLFNITASIFATYSTLVALKFYTSSFFNWQWNNSFSKQVLDSSTSTVALYLLYPFPLTFAIEKVVTDKIHRLSCWQIFRHFSN